MIQIMDWFFCPVPKGFIKSNNEMRAENRIRRSVDNAGARKIIIADIRFVIKEHISWIVCNLHSGFIIMR